MARKSTERGNFGADWFLAEWMAAKAMSQAELGRRTGWGKATTHDIVHGKTGYYRKILNEAAAALHVQPFELLLAPEEANHLRAMRESAIRLAAEERTEWRGRDPDEGLLRRPG